MTRLTSNRCSSHFYFRAKVNLHAHYQYCKHVDYEKSFPSSLAAQLRSDKMSLDASLLFRPTYPKIFGESIAFLAIKFPDLSVLVSKCLIFLFTFSPLSILYRAG